MIPPLGISLVQNVNCHLTGPATLQFKSSRPHYKATKVPTYEKSGSVCDSWVVLLRGVQAALNILSRRLCFSSVFHLHSLWLA